MNNISNNPFIWVNDDQSEFYLSQFDINEYSFLDKVKITSLIGVVTNFPNGSYGDCFSIFDMDKNYAKTPFDNLIGQTFTHALQSQLLLPYKFSQLDVMLSNGLRVRTVLGNDIFFDNSKTIHNFTIVLQQLKKIVRVQNLQPNRLYIMHNKKLYPTKFITENIVDFVLSNPQIFF
jgi:hypothetical protein